MEINARKNGFSLIFDNFQRPERKLYYRADYQSNSKTFSELLRKLAIIKFKNKTILAKNIDTQEGVIIINHDVKSRTAGILIFSPNNRYLQQVSKILMAIDL